MADSNTGATVLAGGHESFLQAARAVEEIVRSHRNLSDTELAEGYQYLAGMWSLHLERSQKGYDVDRPFFVRNMDNFRTWGLPTPDHHYFSAQICGEGEYRIFGQRGTTVDFCFEVLTGLAGDDGVVGERIDVLEANNMHIGPDGSYEIFLGGEPRSRNWLRAGPRARTLFVRQTANDWNAEAASPMLIERIDKVAPPLGRPSPEQVTEIFRRAGKNLVEQVRFLNDLALHWSKVLPLNELPGATVGPADAGYFPGQLNSKCRWEIADDEALLIEFDPVPARYQSLVLAHPLWFNTIRHRSIQSTMTGAQSRRSSDGRYRYVISATDPGVHNWLDTGGLTNGFLFLRFQRSEVTELPKPVVKRLKLADLRAHFPTDEVHVTPADRVALLRSRRLAADRRFA
jgi:hypothetical protein